MTERMKQAVRAYMDWLRMGPEDRSGLGECPVEDRLAPLGLSMQQHEKALRHAMTKLMKKGYVVRMLDGWPQAIPFDDVPEKHREEIIRRRRNPSEDDIVTRHGGVGISFLSVSDEEAEKYYGPPPAKSKTDEQAARPAAGGVVYRNFDGKAVGRDDVDGNVRECVRAYIQGDLSHLAECIVWQEDGFAQEQGVLDDYPEPPDYRLRTRKWEGQ